jgi:hypothetical protein
MSKKKKKSEKEVKKQDFVGKTNFFLSTMSFSSWAISATWLHVGAPQKIEEIFLPRLIWSRNLTRLVFTESLLNM